MSRRSSALRERRYQLVYAKLCMHVYMSRIREGETVSKDDEMDGECDLEGNNEQNAGDDSIQAVGPLFIDQFSTSTTDS